MARSEPGMDIAPDALDCDAWALNVENGTLDLRTGDLREHRREDYCTKLAPVGYDAAALAPTWLAFLNRIFRGNASLIDFMQRLAGYCLTADVGEQVLPIFHGVGANGKSTLLGALLELLGPDYSAKLAPEVVLLRRGESHPTGATDLFGRRMVCVVETDAGKRLAEATIKDLTGGDAIRARRMREDYWQFRPTHKIVMATNHRPAVRGTDHALWRRLRLVPFGEIIGPDEQDRQLPDKLRAELPGILAWAVRGCKQWLAQGLGEPPEVTAATDEYRDTQDLLGAFIAERCFIGPNLRTKAGDLYASYVGWCKDTGETALSQSRFGETLSERGFPREKSGVFWRLGIGLKADQDL
jgi:putative DNA primase/helicase